LETLLLKKGKTLSPTALARDFNLRWRGMPVTVNATRKWLMGEAVPTMDKIETLSSMLNVTADWLRWGDMSVQKPTKESYSSTLSFSNGSMNESSKSFAQDFLLLNPAHRKVVTAIMEVLLEEPRSHQKQESEEDKNITSAA
jgi:hypothetical protein